MGQGDDGTVYIAVSNHDEVAGNVAIFSLDPSTDRIRLLGGSEVGFYGRRQLAERREPVQSPHFLAIGFGWTDLLCDHAVGPT